MFGMRMPELIIIFAIVLLVFGANKIPQLGKSLGETIRGFKKAVESEPEKDVTPAEKPAVKLPPRAAATEEAEAPVERAPAEKRR